MSELSQLHEQLGQAMNRLNRQWQQACTAWDDKARERFDTDFWSCYEPAVAAYLKELKSLASTIARVQREVS